MLRDAPTTAGAAAADGTPPLKGARTSEGGLGMGSGGNIVTNNSIVVDKSELSKLLDSEFETAAQRSESHIDTSIKGLR